jgi:hypothetical protein
VRIGAIRRYRAQIKRNLMREAAEATLTEVTSET